MKIEIDTDKAVIKDVRGLIEALKPVIIWHIAGKYKTLHMDDHGNIETIEAENEKVELDWKKLIEVLN